MHLWKNVCCFHDLIENAASTVPEAETLHTAETSESASSEPVEEDSAKPSTSEQSEELMRKLAEFTANTESVASIGKELENIPQVLSEPQNEQSSHSEKETGVEENDKEFQNLDSDHKTTGNGDTSDTVQLDSRTYVAQSQDDHASEAQSVSVTPESSSLPETLASVESETLDVKQDEPGARQSIPEELNTTEESDIIENSNLNSSRDNTVEEKDEQILSPQVTADETPASKINEDRRTSQMYPNLDSVARESGTSIFRTGPSKSHSG